MASASSSVNAQLVPTKVQILRPRPRNLQYMVSRPGLSGTPRPICRPPRASLSDEEDREKTEIERQRLMKMLNTPSINGTELRQLIMNRWNREYDCRLTRRGRRMYLQIFWKFLGQRSFPLTEEEYQLQLDAVAEYLTMWGVAEVVRAGIASAKYAPGHTIGKMRFQLLILFT